MFIEINSFKNILFNDKEYVLGSGLSEIEKIKLFMGDIFY